MRRGFLWEGGALQQIEEGRPASSPLDNQILSVSTPPAARLHACVNSSGNRTKASVSLSSSSDRRPLAPPLIPLPRCPQIRPLYRGNPLLSLPTTRGVEPVISYVNSKLYANPVTASTTSFLPREPGSCGFPPDHGGTMSPMRTAGAGSSVFVSGKMVYRYQSLLLPVGN